MTSQVLSLVEVKNSLQSNLKKRFRLASCEQFKTFRGTFIVAKVSFLQLLCEICLDFETMLQNIRCFIVYIVIIVLGSFRKQGIVVSFFAIEYKVGKIK